MNNENQHCFYSYCLVLFWCACEIFEFYLLSSFLIASVTAVSKLWVENTTSITKPYNRFNWTRNFVLMLIKLLQTNRSRSSNAEYWNTLIAVIENKYFFRRIFFVMQFSFVSTNFLMCENWMYKTENHFVEFAHRFALGWVHTLWVECQ